MNLVETLRRLVQKLGEPGEIILGRVDLDLRRQIWESDPSELDRVLGEVDRALRERGQKPLSHNELEDAYQGNFVHHHS